MTFTIKDFNVCSVNINVLCKQCQHYYSQMNSYHHGNLKKELLDCALKMCERDGYTKLSIRSLAKESNVSQTAPYRHFKTKEDLYAEVAIEGFNKIHKAISKYDSNDSKRNLIDGAKAYIKFGLKNANTYDLMFGTAIKDFTKYPMLFEAANKTYLHIRSTFKEFSKNKDDLYIEESCIDIWAKIHGMVGLLRKLEVVPVRLVEMPDTPFKAINLISKDLDSYLEKFFNKF